MSAFLLSAIFKVILVHAYSVKICSSILAVYCAQFYKLRKCKNCLLLLTIYQGMCQTHAVFFFSWNVSFFVVVVVVQPLPCSSRRLDLHLFSPNLLHIDQCAYLYVKMLAKNLYRFIYITYLYL